MDRMTDKTTNGRTLVRSSLPTNLFEASTLESTRYHRQTLGPTERISMNSFDRLKSVYKKPSALFKLPKKRPNEDESDDLSLDHILADIEAGKLTNSIVDSSASNQNLVPSFSSLEGCTELQKSQRSEHDFHVTPSTSSSSSMSDLKRVRDNSEKSHDETTNGFEIVWLNFTYSVEPNILEDPRWGRINRPFHKERRTILKGLSGGLKSGQMVALMGPSGAGKTCLLECISGLRITGIDGEICMRGRKSAQLVIVPQYDDFLPQFTVEEIITYGSKMKNSVSTNHEAVVDNVIEQLGLQACRSNNILKCSGGQRKRVAIAQELVSRPNILILDEPTSGLDSSCCYHTIKVLRDVLDKSASTEQPMTIVATIHQPSAKVFKMFDLVYLLGKTGYTAYSGPPEDLLTVIEEITGLQCPQYSNPSDYMIELVSYDYGDDPVEKLVEFEKKKAKEFVKEYERRVKCSNDHNMMRESKFSALNNGQSETIKKKLKTSKSDTQLTMKGNLIAKRLKKISLGHVEYKNNMSVPLRRATSCNKISHPILWHIWVHFHRSFLQSVRDHTLNNMRILIHLGFAILLVLMYGNKSGESRGCPPILGLPSQITDPNNDNMIDLADNVGYLFMCIMMITYVSLMSTVLTFPIDIKTIGKEYKNGWYGPASYFIGKSLADIPFIIAYPIAFCIITWYMTNQAQDHFWRYLSFTGLIIVNAMNSQSFGLILGALFVNSVTAATFLGPIITIPWYLFTGFTKRIHRLAELYRIASKFLFTRYVFEGLLGTVYGYGRCNCSEFLEKYYKLRYEEAVRLGQLVSAETLSSLDYYDDLETVLTTNNATLLSAIENGKLSEKTVDDVPTVIANGLDLNLANLMESNVKATSLFSFGLDFEPTCPTDYRNYVVQDFRLEEQTLENVFVTLLIMMAVVRFLTFALVTWKIRTRQL